MSELKSDTFANQPRPAAGEKECLIWDEKHETMARPELEKLQLERLKSVVARCYNKVPFYRQKMDALGVRPEEINTLKDVSKLPFTTKYDLRENYPFAMFAEPMENVVRLHASRGTTGKPVVAGYTKNDLNTWIELMISFGASSPFLQLNIMIKKNGNVWDYLLPRTGGKRKPLWRR